MVSARRTPLIAAVPKILLPFLVILPGLIAIALPRQVATPLARYQNTGRAVPLGRGLVPVEVDPTNNQPVLDQHGNPQLDYDLAVPNLLLHYFPTGLLGLGFTALLASFMSGMAGNVTAFNTVWTHDIYEAYIRPNAGDSHYLMVGRLSHCFWHSFIDRNGLSDHSFQ
jgi:SSS family solute:Na+ symporter